MGVFLKDLCIDLLAFVSVVGFVATVMLWLIVLVG